MNIQTFNQILIPILVGFITFLILIIFLWKRDYYKLINVYDELSDSFERYKTSMNTFPFNFYMFRKAKMQGIQSGKNPKELRMNSFYCDRLKMLFQDCCRVVPTNSKGQLVLDGVPVIEDNEIIGGWILKCQKKKHTKEN